MGFFSTIFGFCGFGVGISMGLMIGYYLFIYFQPSDVKAKFFYLYVSCIQLFCSSFFLFVFMDCLCSSFSIWLLRNDMKEMLIIIVIVA